MRNMRDGCLIALAVVLASGAVLAQPAAPPGSQDMTNPDKANPPQATKLDKGPFTPEASNAYQGGGVELQGRPGGPAPKPEATPAGQPPRNMVPPSTRP
jgi:hypothetical protein